MAIHIYVFGFKNSTELFSILCNARTTRKFEMAVQKLYIRNSNIGNSTELFKVNMASQKLEIFIILIVYTNYT